MEAIELKHLIITYQFNSKTMSRTERLELLIEIVEAIKLYQKYEASNQENIKRNNTVFGTSTHWYEHRSEINNKVIARLEERYSKQLALLTENK